MSAFCQVATPVGHLSHAPLLPGLLCPAHACLVGHLPLRTLPSLCCNPFCCHAPRSPQVDWRYVWWKILDCYSLDVDFSRNTAEQQWQSWGRPWRAKKWSRKSGWSKEPGFVRTSTSTLSIHQFVSVSVLVNFQVFLFALSGWSSLFVLNGQNMNLICVIKVSCTMYVFCPKILGNGHLNNEWIDNILKTIDKYVKVTQILKNQGWNS